MRYALTAVMAAASLISIAHAQPPGASAQGATPSSAIAATIAKDMDGLMTLYRDLHANPELSEQASATAAQPARRLEAMKFAVTEPVGGTGEVAESGRASSGEGGRQSV